MKFDLRTVQSLGNFDEQTEFRFHGQGLPAKSKANRSESVRQARSLVWRIQQKDSRKDDGERAE